MLSYLTRKGRRPSVVFLRRSPTLVRFVFGFHSGLKSESELDSGSANAIIKSQKFHARYSGTHGQCRRQMNRAKGADGLNGEPMPGPIQNVRTDSPQVPVSGGGIQVRASIGGRGFIDFSERDGANQHAIALDESQIGGRYQLGAPERLAHGRAAFFPEQPREDGGGLRINAHRVPRSSLRSSAA